MHCASSEGQSGTVGLLSDRGARLGAITKPFGDPKGEWDPIRSARLLEKGETTVLPVQAAAETLILLKPELGSAGGGGR